MKESFEGQQPSDWQVHQEKSLPFKGAVDLRSRHFAFRGAVLSLPRRCRSCRVSALPLSPAGVYVPCTPINKVLKTIGQDCSMLIITSKTDMLNTKKRAGRHHSRN